MKTIVIQVRVSVRTLAALVEFFDKQAKYPPRTKGGLLSVSLDFLADVLRQNKQVEQFTTTAAASSFLDGKEIFAEQDDSVQELAKQIALPTAEEEKKNAEDIAVLISEKGDSQLRKAFTP